MKNSSLVRSARRIPFSRSLHSFVKKRLSRWLGQGTAEGVEPEITAELFRSPDSPWVRCHLEVHAGTLDVSVDELARGPQQALEACAEQVRSILADRLQFGPGPGLALHLAHA